MDKKTAFEWCSKFCRLRDALLWCLAHGIDVMEFIVVEDIPVGCCTCDEQRPWLRMVAGHYYSRKGGGSGVYFDERNINAQCPECNSFEGGRPAEYTEFMLRRYGQAVIDELRRKDNHPEYEPGGITRTGRMYKRRFNTMCKTLTVADWPAVERIPLAVPALPQVSPRVPALAKPAQGFFLQAETFQSFLW